MRVLDPGSVTPAGSEDALTIALAIWGAVTGTAGVLLGLIVLWLDRPKLNLHGYWIRRGPDQAKFHIVIHNAGRRPTSVVELGLATSLREPIPDALRNFVDMALVPKDPQDVSDKPLLLSPGATEIFRLDMNNGPLPVHADTPLVIYARAATGRGAVGPETSLRRLLEGGWQPPAGSDPKLLDPLPSGIKVKSAQRWWRWWRWRQRHDLPKPLAMVYF